MNVAHERRSSKHLSQMAAKKRAKSGLLIKNLQFQKKQILFAVFTDIAGELRSSRIRVLVSFSFLHRSLATEEFAETLILERCFTIKKTIKIIKICFLSLCPTTWDGHFKKQSLDACKIVL